MASEKILNLKKDVVKEITSKIKDSESVILFSYQGLTVTDMSELRRKLREDEAEVKIYKNTLLKRALDDLKIDLTDFMEGPNALLFGKKLLEPIKTISDFAKNHDKLEIRIGVISGEVAEIDKIKEYASIPSRDGLLTMLAGGMIQFVKDLSIGLNLYAEKLNDGKSIEVKEEQVEQVQPETEEKEEVTVETENSEETDTATLESSEEDVLKNEEENN